MTAERLPEEEAATLLRNLHAVWLIGKWMDTKKLEALCRPLAARVPVYTLAYPRAYALLPTLAKRLEDVAASL